MTKNTFIISSLLLSATLGLGYLLTQSDAPTEDATARTSKATTNPSKKQPKGLKDSSQIRSLEYRLGDLEDQVDGLVADGEVEFAPERPEGQEELPPGASEQAFNLPAEAIVDNFDQYLENEDRDDAWASEKEEAIAEAMSADLEYLDGVAVQDISCATSFCRLRTAHSDQMGVENFLDNRSSISPLRGQGFVNVNEDDNTVQIYVAREGHNLPDPMAS